MAELPVSKIRAGNCPLARFNGAKLAPTPAIISPASTFCLAKSRRKNRETGAANGLVRFASVAGKFFDCTTRVGGFAEYLWVFVLEGFFLLCDGSLYVWNGVCSNKICWVILAVICCAFLCEELSGSFRLWSILFFLKVFFLVQSVVDSFYFVLVSLITSQVHVSLVCFTIWPID